MPGRAFIHYFLKIFSRKKKSPAFQFVFGCKRCDSHFWTVCFQIDHLEKETILLRQSEGSNVVFKGVDLPDGIAPSSANIINSQNEYLIHILQVVKILHMNNKSNW